MNGPGAPFPTASMWRWCCYHDTDVALMSLPAPRDVLSAERMRRVGPGCTRRIGPGWALPGQCDVGAAFWGERWSWWTHGQASGSGTPSSSPRCLIVRSRLSGPVRCPVPAAAAAAVTGTMW